MSIHSFFMFVLVTGVPWVLCACGSGGADSAASATGGSGAGHGGAGAGQGGSGGSGQGGGGSGGQGGGTGGGTAGPPEFTVELFEPLPNQVVGLPLGMNELGEIVGYSAPEPYHPLSLPLQVDAAGMVFGLDVPEANYGFAYAANENGLVTGTFTQQPQVWDAGTRHTLSVADGFFSGSANDVANDGTIVGSYGDSDMAGPQHCYWPDRNAKPMLLPGVFSGTTTGSAWAINESGQIAGASGGISGAFRAVRWDSPQAAPLPIGPLPGGINSEGRGINAAGDVAGRSAFPDYTAEAFLYQSQSASLIGLGFLPGGDGYSEAFDVNDKQQVVGTARAQGGVAHAFLWHSGTLYDLNDLLVDPDPRILYLSSAVAVNEAGQIAGEAVVQGGTGDMPRWIVRLTPVN